MTDKLLLQHDAGLVQITLNRGDQANAIDRDLAHDLYQAALYCANSPQQEQNVRAVLLTGKGNFFSAGGDLAAIAEHRDDPLWLADLVNHLHAAITLFRRMPAPLVVAVNGSAAGAGLSLVLAGDYIIADEKARFVSAYTAAAVSPDGGLTYSLPRAIGAVRAKEMILTNRRLNAHEALSWGLINRMVAAKHLNDTALEQCRRFAEGATLAFAAVKKLTESAFTQTLESQLAAEAESVQQLFASQDGIEGVDAFLGKRTPCFVGKA